MSGKRSDTLFDHSLTIEACRHRVNPVRRVEHDSTFLTLEKRASLAFLIQHDDIYVAASFHYLYMNLWRATFQVQVN